MDPDHICKKSRRMGGKQRQICKNEPEIVKEVARGTLLALKVCVRGVRIYGVRICKICVSADVRGDGV